MITFNGSSRRARIVGICALVLSGASLADDLSLKDILGRAQTQSERQAVEDLIQKLQSRSRAPDQAPAAAAPKLTLPERAPAVETPPSRQQSETQTAAPVGSAPAPQGPAVPAVLPENERATQAATAVPGRAPERSPAAGTAAYAPGVPGAAGSAATAALDTATEGALPSVDLEVYFDTGSAEITEQASSVLTTLGRALTDARLAGGTFLIAGHTDAKGGAQYNMRLSQARAESVRQFLMQHFGIDRARLVAKGYGLRRLKNPRNSQAAENRRVQVVNLSQQTTGR
jgi:outer membrane protein OmpA-like peptidoglycan-associated protein